MKPLKSDCLHLLFAALSRPCWTPTLPHSLARQNPNWRAKRVASDLLHFFALLVAVASISLHAAELQNNSVPGATLTLSPSNTTIWQGPVGEGFRADAQTLSLEAGAARGIAAFGSPQAHDLALASISYGHILGRVSGKEHWYRGNWEIRAELFAGGQFSPRNNWLVGLTPHLRYDFSTGTRWIPFLDGGAGLTATGIGPPDLSNTFEFNLQAGAGAHWFASDNIALTVEARYIHLSDAGISHPNDGVNALIGMVGLTWFFSERARAVNP